jgi:hypothetical protein
MRFLRKAHLSFAPSPATPIAIKLRVGRTTHQRAWIIYPNFISCPALANRGAEVIFGDLNDTDSLIEAFTGVYGVFGITDCASFRPRVYYCWIDNIASLVWTAEGKETEHGKNLVDAAKAARVQHFVWSTLDGDHGVPHFDTKAAVDKYLMEKEVPHTL